MKKIIVLTGGGTAGHVSVNLGLIPRLREADWDINYIGSEEGIEKELVSDFPYVKYYSIPTGKLRRYPSFSNIKANLKDVGRVIKGASQAKKILREIGCQIVFSKGGFVSAPVAYGAGRLGIPVISHESDITPGLANKMVLPFTDTILTTFRETLEYLPKNKGLYLGPIIRDQIKGGSKEAGLKAFGFKGDRPILLILGGSSGAQKINEAIWANLERLLEDFDILHGTGKGKIRKDIEKAGYKQVEYIKDNMKDVLAMADIIVSRSGSNAIFEFLYYAKPMLLIPYGEGSRGDQILNAESLVKEGYAKSLAENMLGGGSLLRAIKDLYEIRDKYIDREKTFEFKDGLSEIVKLLEEKRLETGL